MKPAHAVAELRDAADSQRLGTAFAISRSLALTAFHVVRDHDRVLLRFVDQQIFATVVHDTAGEDQHNDLALLLLIDRLDDDLPFLPLSGDARIDDAVIAIGFPYAVAAPRFVVGGRIRNPHAEHPKRSHASEPDRYIQWLCEEAMTSLQLRGLSGAPLIGDAATSPKALGVVIYNEPGEEGAAKGAAVWAAAAETVTTIWPQETDTLLRRRRREILVAPIAADIESPIIDVASADLSPATILDGTWSPLSVRWLDPETVVAATRGAEIWVIHLQDGSTDFYPSKGAYSTYLASHGAMVVAATYTRLRVLDLSSREERFLPLDDAAGSNCVDWRADGAYLAVGGTNDLRVFDAQMTQVAEEALGGRHGVRSLTFDGDVLWIALGNGEIRKAIPPYTEWESVHRREGAAVIGLRALAGRSLVALWQDGLLEVAAGSDSSQRFRTAGKDSWGGWGPKLACALKSPIVWCSGLDRALYAAMLDGPRVMKATFPADVRTLDIDPSGSMLAVGLDELNRQDASILTIETSSIEETIRDARERAHAEPPENHLLRADWTPLIDRVKGERLGADDLDEITTRIVPLDDGLKTYERSVENVDAEPSIVKQLRGYLAKARSRSSRVDDDLLWLASAMIDAGYFDPQIAIALDRYCSFDTVSILGQLGVYGYPSDTSLEEYVAYVLGVQPEDVLYLGFDTRTGQGVSAGVPVSMLAECPHLMETGSALTHGSEENQRAIIGAALRLGDFDYLLSYDEQRRLWYEVVLPQAAVRYPKERLVVNSSEIVRMGFS